MPEVSSDSASPPTNPHDAVFRAVLSDSANAASLVRAVLPAGLVAHLDLDRLAPAPGGFVNPQLQSRYADLVFRVAIAAGEAIGYLLVEHQSSIDPVMAHRMLGYVAQVREHHQKQHRAARPPLVIPLVVHHGPRRWTAALDAAELTDWGPIGNHPDLVAQLVPYQPRMQYWLDDLAALDVGQLRARPLTAATRMLLILLKIAPGNPNLAADLGDWLPDLGELADHQADVFSALLRYIYLVGDAPPDDLIEVLAQLGPTVKEEYMTTAEVLEERGAARGRAEGRAEMLVQLLTAKFGPLTDEQKDRVRAASTEQLLAWTNQILTATSVNDALS